MAKKFFITVKPNARKNEVIRNDDGTFIIFVSVPPIEGKANQKTIELISEYFHIPKRSISIVAGLKGKTKIIEVQ